VEEALEVSAYSNHELNYNLRSNQRAPSFPLFELLLPLLGLFQSALIKLCKWELKDSRVEEKNGVYA
jgi:hypothetical protein